MPKWRWVGRVCWIGLEEVGSPADVFEFFAVEFQNHRLQSLGESRGGVDIAMFLLPGIIARFLVLIFGVLIAQRAQQGVEGDVYGRKNAEQWDLGKVVGVGIRLDHGLISPSDLRIWLMTSRSTSLRFLRAEDRNAEWAMRSMSRRLPPVASCSMDIASAVNRSLEHPARASRVLM